MVGFLRNIKLDQLSFWLGFIAASLFWWLYTRIRPGFPVVWEKIKDLIRTAREGLQTDTEKRHRITTLQLAQNMHIASSIFSLDEILIPPRLLTPSPLVLDEEVPPYEDIVQLTVPYTPDWPELASHYGAHNLSPLQAISGGANLAIIGPPGIGKSVILADLATQLANRNPEAGDYQNHVPVLIHAYELPYPRQLDNSFEDLLTAVSVKASPLALPRLPGFMRTILENGRVVLLIDGLDEIHPESLPGLVDYLTALLQEFPKVQIVVSASTDYLDGLNKIGFIPIAVATWNSQLQAQFIQKWSNLWGLFVEPENQDNAHQIDPIMLNEWLKYQNIGLTPLEFTLKVWSAYAGDIRGAQGSHAVEAYIRRMLVGIPDSRSELEEFALQLIYSNWQSPEEVLQNNTEENEDEHILDVSDEEANLDTDIHTPVDHKGIQRYLPELINSGLLIDRSKSRIGFAHPIVCGYLASFSLDQTSLDTSFYTQPTWVLKDIALHYLASRADLSDIAQEFFDQIDDPLKRGLLKVGRWLKDIPQNEKWQNIILQNLSSLLHRESLPLGLRVRALTAAAYSDAPGIPTLFRRMVKSDKITIRQLGALGCGLIRDTQSIDDLDVLLDEQPSISRAACLALVNIGTRSSLNIVADALVEGNEDLRRSAAEAFAGNPDEGHDALKEGSAMDDLLLRRSVIYGLRKINEPWSVAILEQMQIEDGQWVVRNAAVQAVEELQQFDPHIPLPLEPLEDTPWLIAYASQHGMGVSSGQPARSMLIRAFMEGSKDERLTAMDHIRIRGDAGIFPEIYHLIYGDNYELREAAFNTLWHISLTGSEIPPPNQFGLG